MTDWIEQDYTMLAENEERWAGAREVRKACDPRKGLADTICSRCRGSGLDPDDTRFVWDEFNPEGYWENEPCLECRGTGLSKGINDALECGDLDHLSLLSARAALTRALEGLYKARQTIEDLPPVKGHQKTVERALGALVDELTELLGELDPDPKE